MIPIYKSTLTRLDLSNVLSYMVENNLEGETSGQQLAKEICNITGYDGAIALRNPVDAVLYAMELKNCNSLLMPVLAPHVLYSRLMSLGKKIQLYDIDIDTMLPLSYPEHPIQYSDTMMNINLGYFGSDFTSYIHSKSTEGTSTLQEFQDISTIEIAYSLDYASVFCNSTQKNSDADLDFETSVPIESTKKPDFKIILLENNTLCTAGGGAILLVSGVKLAGALRKKIAYLHSWLALTDFNASLALAQLKQIDEFAKRLEKLLPLYKQAIQRTRHKSLSIIFSKNAMPQCFPIMISSRVNEVVKYIRKQGIESEFPFLKSTLGMLMEKFSSNEERTLELYAHGSKYVTNVISLPLYSALEEEEVSKIVSAISTLP